MYLIGLDIGTTGCKAAIFDVEGHLLTSASREYAVNIPHPSWAEQNAEHVWELAQDTLKQAVAQAPEGEIGAVGLSVQGEAVIPVDTDGNALRPAILGMDTRTDAENMRLRQEIGARELFEHTGMPIHTINTLPKLLWLRQHEPMTWHNAARFLLYEDFIIHKMTGHASISKCLASRTQLYDLHQDCWSPKILDLLELTPDQLAEVHPSGFVAGPMHKALADTLGFKKPPLVVTGGHDQACGALGVGLIESGLAMVSTGTAEVVEVALSSPRLNQKLYEGNISVYAHVVPGLYLAMTLNHSGGLLLRWFRDTFGQEEIRAAQKTDQDAYDLLLQEAPQEPTHLLVLPHFSGSGTPTFDTQSKGAILGLDFGTKKADLAKAILEGLTYELRVNLDLLREGNVAIEQLRAIGGGARSELWLQLKADITGIPVVVPRITEAACWGAALLAGVGAGCYKDLGKTFTKLEQHITPNSKNAEIYEERYALYRNVYPATRPIHHSL